MVRNDLAHTLIIQGVAGSGKTSIALHRIAYLLYKYKESLSSERVMILSPNKVFADYISTVLPELGEEPIRESSLGEIAEKILPSKYKFISLYEQTKQLIECPESALAKRVAFKSSLHFFEQLTAFLNNQNTDLLMPKDITIQEIDIAANYMTERFASYAKEPVSKRIEHVAEDLLAVVKAKRQGEVKLPSKNEIVKRLKKRLRFTDALSLYKAFFENVGQPEQFIWKRGTFEFADVYPYLYCKAYMDGVDTFDLVNHLVIDEMQDYTPVQYAVIQKLFRCKKTILGDFGQSLNPFAVSTSNGFQAIFPQMEYVELKKSYRSSFEIIEFTKQFLPENAIEAIERHGEQPTIENYINFAEQTEKIKHYLKEFEASSYKTCGIVCKTAAQVEELYGVLQKEFNVHKLDEHSTAFAEGITLSSVQLAKGLEFDAVIVPFVDEASYASNFDKGLLYVACTRAMHQLTLLQSSNNFSPLLLGQVGAVQ
ncbi:HelD family protein [Lysinibacillus sp. NPDC097287]|uniref:HelD family protein n=1 Tax=Lysinibacillus sp. NPDC097287 TaxID=3364144 RepID=UPI00381445EF